MYEVEEKLKSVGLPLMAISGMVTSRSAHLASVELPASQPAVSLTKANDVAVSPITGEVYVIDWDAGAIFRANPNGTVTLLTSGLSNDATYIAFAPDGTLYHMGIIPGFSRISTVDGRRG
jgi:hypothetical protein